MVLPMRGGCAANVEQVDKTLDCMYKNWGVHDGALPMDERHLRIKGSWAQQYLFRIRPKVNSSFATKLPMTVPRLLGYVVSDIEINRYGDAGGKGSTQDTTVDTWSRGQGLLVDTASRAFTDVAILGHQTVQHHMQTMEGYTVKVSPGMNDSVGDQSCTLQPKLVIPVAKYQKLRLSPRLGLLPTCHSLQTYLNKSPFPTQYLNSAFFDNNLKTGVTHAARQRVRIDQLVFNILTLINNDTASDFTGKLGDFVVDLREWGYGGADRIGDNLLFTDDDM
jgi:hypothetical protein